MTRRACYVLNPENPPYFHRLRISLFFPSTRSSFQCLKVAVTSVATSPAVSAPSYHFPFHSSIFADLSTPHFRCPSLSSHLALFSPSTCTSCLCLRVKSSSNTPVMQRTRRAHKERGWYAPHNILLASCPSGRRSGSVVRRFDSLALSEVPDVVLCLFAQGEGAFLRIAP